ncbi:MAG: MotA/TolQ/ExbB proton channel family protein [Candidatus Omnitrophica bacterium]|nr:MotA/TolQ/ExbB proton channel family protein [Candidatus Omnitrophota bacterium]
MSFLTNILYWIAMAFLMPVVVLLVVAFVWSLFMLGGFYGVYMERLKFKRDIGQVLSDLRDKNIPEFQFPESINGNRRFMACLKEAVTLKWHPVHVEKILADFEVKGEKELEASKILIRIGPMLGLMGTLIPLGPALVGLASGDIGTMAINMQVAFSTTVVGIFCGAIGFVTHLVKKRWFVEDINNLQYIFNLARKEG